MSTAFRSFYRYIALLVSICLIFSLVGPSLANAAPGEKNREPVKKDLQPVVGELPAKLPKEKVELTNKRTPYSSRYLNPDGSFTEKIFTEQEYYQDPSDKKWKKINNKLKKNTKNGKLENTASDQATQFSEESGEGDLVTIEKKGKNVRLVPVKTKKVRGAVKDNEIKYDGIFNHADLRYRLDGSKVKEDIILHQYDNQDTFRFELKTKGVTPHKEKDGTIVFKDSKGKKLWFFQTPYMTDADGTYSGNVSLELKEVEGKTYVDVVADEAFLKDPQTKYPVTIDPTVEGWNILRDNFVASAFPDSAYKTNTYLHTGNHSYFGNTRYFITLCLAITIQILADF